MRIVDRDRRTTLGITVAACACWLLGPCGSASADSPKLVAPNALLRVVETASAPARAPGVIASMGVREGSLVEEGEVVAQIDASEPKLQRQRAAIEHELARLNARSDTEVRSAEETLEFSKEEWERLTRAAGGMPGSVSQSELAESRVAVSQAEIEVEAARHKHRLEELNADFKSVERELAELRVDVHQIEAPLKGVVVEVLRRRGEWVEPGEDVLRIVRTDRLRAEGLFAATGLPTDLVGAPAKIESASAAGGKVAADGRVVFVSPEINPISGQVLVWAEFDNPGPLKPGMRATLTLSPKSPAETDGDTHP